MTLSIPLEARRASVEEIPWVEAATVQRVLPHSLRVYVRERTPVAFLRQGASLWLVDRHGVLLPTPEGTAYSFPVIVGLSEGLTTEERRERLGRELDSSLREFDGLILKEQQLLDEKRDAEAASAETGAGTGTGTGTGVGSGSEGEGDKGSGEGGEGESDGGGADAGTGAKGSIDGGATAETSAGGTGGSPDLPAGEVDVAILCVPGWKNVEGYPGELLRRLQPAHVVLSHYNDFFGDRDARDVVASADLEDFLRECQEAADYPGLRSIVVPDLDGTLLFRQEER